MPWGSFAVPCCFYLDCYHARRRLGLINNCSVAQKNIAFLTVLCFFFTRSTAGHSNYRGFGGKRGSFGLVASLVAFALALDFPKFPNWCNVDEVYSGEACKSKLHSWRLAWWLRGDSTEVLLCVYPGHKEDLKKCDQCTMHETVRNWSFHSLCTHQWCIQTIGTWHYNHSAPRTPRWKKNHRNHRWSLLSHRWVVE